MSVNPLPPEAYTKDTLQKAYAWLLTQGSAVKEMAKDQNILVSLYLKAQRNGEASLDTPSIHHFKEELKSLASMMGELHEQNSPSYIHYNQTPKMPHQRSPLQHPEVARPAQHSPMQNSNVHMNSQNRVQTSVQTNVQTDDPHGNFNSVLSTPVQPQNPDTKPVQLTLTPLQSSALTPTAMTHQQAPDSHLQQPSAQNNSRLPQQTHVVSQSGLPQHYALTHDLIDTRTLAAIDKVKQSLNLTSDAEALRVIISLGIKHFKKLNLDD